MRRLLVAALMVVSVGASLFVALAPNDAGPSEPTTGSAMLTGADSPTVSETKPATRTRTVRPITSDGRLKPGYEVAEAGLGDCFWSSVASQQEGAFRCVEGNGIYDPCFAASERKVFCLDTPWTRRVLELRIERLPRRRNEGIDRMSTPWGMRLSDGTRCVLGTGTANWIQDTALPYHCEHGYSTEPSTEHHHWRVKVAPMTLDRLRPRRVEVALY